MSRGMNRADRLREMERLYTQQAFTDIEMAARLGVDRTTIYKDRTALETEHPFSEVETGRYKIDRTRYLSGIKVSLHEALALYLAERRASRQTRISQPHVASALEKLAIALKQPMTERLVKAAGEVLRQSAQPERILVLETLARAWVDQQKVRIVYHPLRGKRALTYTVSPYLIEPSLWSDGTYVIGHSDVHNDVATFKIERITQADLLLERFTIPTTFDDQTLLKYAWGIWLSDEEPVTVRLKFTGHEAVTRLKESIWHPQQQPLFDTPDGGCMWAAPVAEPQEMLPWIRGWGASVEVLEPKELREAVTSEIRRMASRYNILPRTLSPETARLFRCWGKTGQQINEFHPAVFHMLDVGNVARTLLSSQASPRWRDSLAHALGAEAGSLVEWLPWLVALHDLGKISAAFQGKNEEQRMRLVAEGFSFGEWRWNQDLHHTAVGFAHIANDAWVPQPMRRVWGEVIAGHHGWFAPPGTLRETRNKLTTYEPLDWGNLRTLAANTLKAQLLTRTPEPWPTPPNISAAIMALTGFTILCDWLGSNSFQFRLSSEIEFETYAEDSVQRAQRAVAEAGFFQNSRSAAPQPFSALFPKIETPRPLQLAIDEIPAEALTAPCLVVIEAATGEGKTEMSLALAHRIGQLLGTDELYYALPTTATSNQMFGRLQRYLSDNLGLTTQIKLIHGQAFLFEDDLRMEPLDNDDGVKSGAVMDWFSPKKRALLAPFGVGTIDQVELAALNVKHAALRMIGLAGKVVIVDEVHAYDTYMTTIIERLLEWLSALGTSVILLSATLPHSRRANLARAYGVELEESSDMQHAYPSLWVASKAGSHHVSPPSQQPDRRIALSQLHYGDDDTEDKAKWLLETIVTGGCVCYIANTVSRAQRVFEAVDRLAPADVDRMLLHAQFPLTDRQKLETTIAQKYGPGHDHRPVRGIVVGTQVLEQSLDLDFDVMASDLAPIDLLLQRAGRLHRHARKRPALHTNPQLWINFEVEADGDLRVGVDRWIYAEYFLRQTWLNLSARAEINLPADYRRLIEAVYDAPEPAPDSPLYIAWRKLQDQELDAIGEANQRLLQEPDPEEPFCASTASLTFEESENSAAWLVAQTRLGEESVTVIPLERSGILCHWIGGESEVRLDAEASREVQLQLLRQSLRVSNRAAVKALTASTEPLPSLFTESVLLKECRPIWLHNGQARLGMPRGALILTLDPKLGLVITMEGG